MDTTSRAYRSLSFNVKWDFFAVQWCEGRPWPRLERHSTPRDWLKPQKASTKNFTIQQQLKDTKQVTVRYRKAWATRCKSHDLQPNAHAHRLGFLVPSKYCQKVRTVIQKDANKILKAHLRSHYWGCSVLIRVHDNWRNFLWGLTEDVHIVFLLTHILRCCNNKIFTHFYLHKIWYYREPKLAALLVWWRDYRRKKILHKVM